MKSLKVEIALLLQNEKVADFFANSDGQGMLPSDCDRLFNFKELLELKEVLVSPAVQSFLSKNEELVNVQNFFKFFQRRVVFVANIYEESNNPDYIIDKVIKPNKKEIIKKFPNLPKAEAFKTFFDHYQLKHKELEERTFEQVKDFFENPVAWI